MGASCQLTPTRVEITSVNNAYLERGDLYVETLGRGFAWLDTGTMESLIDAGDFVRTIQSQQGIRISAPEEIAYNMRWISKEDLIKSANKYGKSSYGQHLMAVAEGKILYQSNRPGEQPVWGTEAGVYHEDF